MWQRFTESARKAIFSAQEEAQRFGEGYVSTEHLLLGLLHEEDSTSSKVLKGLGVPLARIRMEVEKQLPRRDARPSHDMTLTPRAKRVIDLAYQEARDLGNNYIGTEHLLLGLIVEGEGLAGRVLAKIGIEREAVREAVAAFQGERGIVPTAPTSPPVQPAAADFKAFPFLFGPHQCWLPVTSLLQVILSTPESVPCLASVAGAHYGAILRNIELALTDPAAASSAGPTITSLLATACREAEDLRSPSVTADHVVLALLADGTDPATQCFTHAGVTPEALREKIREGQPG